VVRLSVRFNLQPGQYTLTLGVSELGHAQDWHEHLGPIEVYFDAEGPLPFGGIADLPIECRHAPIEKAGAETAQSAQVS
jgi:hypothetical protein